MYAKPEPKIDSTQGKRAAAHSFKPHGQLSHNEHIETPFSKFNTGSKDSYPLQYVQCDFQKSSAPASSILAPEQSEFGIDSHRLSSIAQTTPFIQRYQDESYSTEKGTFTLSNDETLALKNDAIKHDLYAKRGMIKKSNRILKKLDSALRLVESSETIKVGKNNKKLVKIKPRNVKNKTPNKKTMEMTLPASCDETNVAVVGTNRRQAVTNKFKVQGHPFIMKAEIMIPWLSKERKRLEQITGHAEALKAKRKISLIDRSLANAKALRKELDLAKKEYDSITENDPDYKMNRKAKEIKINSKLKQYSDETWTYYNSLKDTSEKEKIDKELGINRFAKPKLGQSYTIIRGGARVTKGRPYPFHWAAVILESKNREDVVTLEHFATKKDAPADNRWKFSMYGKSEKQQNQSFHQKHTESKRTNFYGKHPVTVVTEPHS